jgi:deazaflavin-dependent oxidoreductase (nitroreductase family)
MSTTSQAARKSQAAGIGKSLQRLFMRGHVSLFRLTGGKVGGGEHMLILTTIGRKSGVKRDTPLFFFRDGDQFIIIASDGGAPKHPTWFLNLKSNPQAKIQVGAQVIPVTTKQAEGEELARLWSIIGENYKNFVQYQTRTSREIPVVILTPSR